MKQFLIFFLFCSYAAISQDSSSVYLKKEYIAPEGGRLPYRILFPEDYDESKKYPLVLFLHGAGERGSDNERQLVHGSKLFLDASFRKKYPAIVVFPQCAKESYWSSVGVDRTTPPFTLDFNYTVPATEPLTLTMKLVDDLIRTERVDRRCVYITGLSMGGMGTFEAVHRYPTTFAAALPICGGGDTNHYEKVKTPFWVFHGDADAIVAVDYSRAMVAKLKEEKVKVKYTEYPGVNHNSWDSAFAEPDFFKWMFSKRLK